MIEKKSILLYYIYIVLNIEDDVIININLSQEGTKLDFAVGLFIDKRVTLRQDAAVASISQSQILKYNKSGVVTRMVYKNTTSQEWEFDNRKRISHIKITGPSGGIEDLTYTLNGAGDILSINENEYTYDGFDRIVGASTLIPGITDQVKLVEKYFGTYNGGDPIGGTAG